MSIFRRDGTIAIPNPDRIDRVLWLNIGFFRFKFSMNFQINFCSHLQIVAALLRFEPHPG